MLIDNENKNMKVHEWLAKYNEEGSLDIVTGYFTVGALAHLSKITKEKISKYRFILGDIVSQDTGKIKALDLLNENVGIETALKLKSLSQEAVEFLKLDKVEVKTLEPNFCHAKLYLKTAEADDRNNYYISGSSNLTEAGIGKNPTSNVELNLAECSNNNQFIELHGWFNQLWLKPQAHYEKTVTENGKTKKIPFKQYLIDEMSKLFDIYTPEQIYFKILFELFKEDEEDDDFKKNFGKLENTAIFRKLYPFQQSGANSLIKMLDKFGGAILADAVGLGKTWTALAIMKFYQMKGTEVILLCPKKLELNWSQYLKRKNSIFEEDAFDYVIRFHTDLREDGMNKRDANLDFFTNDKPKLFVIDESHNLRNDKSKRYEFLLEEILQRSKGDDKVLMLSATPINNSFKDIRNQFKFMVKGENDGFKEKLDINNLEATFKDAQAYFNKWSREEAATLADFHKEIKDSNFFKLTDNLLVARTRKKIKSTYGSTIFFPKHKKPINIFKTPLKFGDVECFAELLDNLKLKLSAYQPSFYTESLEEKKRKKKEKQEKKKKGMKQEQGGILTDNIQREFFLVKMMLILLLKRLESSWYAFHITVGRIYAHHEKALLNISNYEETKKDNNIEYDKDTLDEVTDEDETGILDEFTFGKKSPVKLSDIDKAGMLDLFKKDIKSDKKDLKHILDNVEHFAKIIEAETSNGTQDPKLEELLEIIERKKKLTNKKIVVFSAYKDTCEYIFNQLQKRSVKNYAMVSGDEVKDWRNTTFKSHEVILQRFAPYTKLFKEKNWKDFEPSSDTLSNREEYLEWADWAKTNENGFYALYEDQIDILLATDILSEGQNLQDSDMVINYDIHWNPVRAIQRVGRIDRIGSPNEVIQSINFWPAKDIDDYIYLKERVERRMAIMKLAGSEVIESFTDNFELIAQDESLEERQNAVLMKQMADTMDELESKKNLDFSDLTFETHRQLLKEMLMQKTKEFENMPKGVFSGLKIEHDREMKNGIIAMLGYPAQKKYDPGHVYTSKELIYIDLDGCQISNNQKIILDSLYRHYKEPRFVESKIDAGDAGSIKELSEALNKWMDNQKRRVITLDDGTKKEVIGDAGLSLLEKLKSGKKEAVQMIKKEGKISDRYNFDNFDLLTWLIITK
ncbi:MAG: helicase [Candidatus Delongbacteria bacterium]|nr:helicase [Candidatus Delongbacteria bacterium]